MHIVSVGRLRTQCFKMSFNYEVVLNKTINNSYICTMVSWEFTDLFMCCTAHACIHVYIYILRNVHYSILLCFHHLSTCISLVHKDSGNIFILIQATRKLFDCPFLYLMNPFELLIINFRYMIFTNTCKSVLQISRFFAMVGLLLKLLIYNYRIYYRLQLFLKYYVFSTV